MTVVFRRALRAPRVRLTLASLLILVSGAHVARAQGSGPQVERPVAFDVARRVIVVTPTTASRWKLGPPEWPLGGDWTEARLFTADTVVGSATLVVQRVDGSVARYAYSAVELQRLRSLIDAAVLAQGMGDGARGTTGLERSEPAGNSFVRSQTVLGLIAYGPATAAILSDNGAAAAGGYLLAAGSAFFISARTVRDRSVTRAQNTLASHGGTRGAIAGAGIAAIGNADGGVGYGIPILAGAIGGTVIGFRSAGDMSDGEASSSGFAADLFALTAVGLSGVFGAFKEDTAYHGDGTPPSVKVAIGAGLVSGAAGYWIGPRYAHRSAYNVTTGDISVAYMGMILGGLAAGSTISSHTSHAAGFGAVTAGMLVGTVLADRLLVRKADRTPADGTLTVVGTLAGTLMGAGIAAIAETEVQGALALGSLGGVLGLAIADRIVRPAPDAGPMSGVLPSGSASIGSRSSSRVSLSIVPAAASLALGMSSAQGGRPTSAQANGRVAIKNVPVMRIAF